MARTRRTKTLTDFIWDNRITSTELARRLGISRQFMSELRSGKRTPSLAVAVRIADVCGVPVESWVSPKQRKSPTA
jgi:transcriptional regulator with XRE-family HTH domain